VLAAGLGTTYSYVVIPQSVAQGLRPDQVLAIVTPAAIVQEMFVTRCQRNTVRGAQVCGGAQVPAAMQTATVNLNLSSENAVKRFVEPKALLSVWKK
jgi:hypothetical protein